MDEIPSVVVDPLPPELEAVAAVRPPPGRCQCCQAFSVGCPAAVRRRHAHLLHTWPACWLAANRAWRCLPHAALLRCYAVPPAQRPTATAGGLPPAQGYVVLERPYGFKQWVDKYLDSVPGER